MKSLGCKEKRQRCGRCSQYLSYTQTHTGTLTCTDMDADDGLTAVIHQASERKLAEERARERGKLVEWQRKVHWYWLGYVVVDVAMVFKHLDI